MKQYCSTLFINVILIALVIASLEIWYRFCAPKNPVWYVPDKIIGWIPAPNARILINEDQKKYATTNEDGFRAWGNLASNKSKVLFVGDSFTGDANTSNDDAYFGVVAQNLPIEVFAVGGGGYGTLQEYLLLKRYIDKIRPDILVIQFCQNDFSDNSFVMEENTIISTQKNFRPYLVDNRIVYRDADLYRWLIDNSFAFRVFAGALQGYLGKLYGGYYPPKYHDEIMGALDSATRTTKALLSKVAKSVPAETKIATFNCVAKDKDLYRRWINAAKEVGFEVWDDVAKTIDDAESDGVNVRIEDGAHWNRLGNRLAGEAIGNHLLLAIEKRKVRSDFRRSQE